MRFLFALFLVSAAISVFSDDQHAEISYYDSSGKMKMLKLPYYIDTHKIQYGVKFGVTLYKVEIMDCAPSFGDNMDEYFAAYVEVPSECDAAEIIKETDNHGADFIFIDLRHHYDFDKLLSNKYQTPVFIIENANEENFFKFDETSNSKRYINIFFDMVS